MNKKILFAVSLILCLCMVFNVFAAQSVYTTESGTLTINKVCDGNVCLTKTVENIKGITQLTVTDTITVNGEEKAFSYFEYETNGGKSIASKTNPFKFYSTGNMTVNAVYGAKSTTEKSTGYFKDSVTVDDKIYYFINTLGNYENKGIKATNGNTYDVTGGSGYEDGSSGQYIVSIPTQTSITWDFSDKSIFKDTELTSAKTYNGLTVYADGTKKVTFDDTRLKFGGTGDFKGESRARVVSFNVAGNCTIKIKAANAAGSTSTDTAARSLKLKAGESTEYTVGSFGKGEDAKEVTYNYSGTGDTIYIGSGSSGINLYYITVIYKNSGVISVDQQTQQTTAESSTQTTTESSEDTGVVKSAKTESELTSAISSIESTKGGGTVYVENNINMTNQLALKSTKGNPVKIVGRQQSDGTYPVLDFKTFRDSKIGSTGSTLNGSNDYGVGVRISGSDYTVKNLIIQKAADNGIQIKGSSANNNTVENCIIRYNNDAGVQITGGASNNKIRFVYSYRNCDVYTRGGNADGFAPKLGATKGNSFYGCYAWENSDDGWDSFDKTDSGYTYDLTYERSACWNNGNPDIFTGKYDYDNGNTLDEDLFLVELIEKQDSSFKTNYNSKKFSLPSEQFINTDAGLIDIASWTSTNKDGNYDGNPNGFKFGSINTKADCTRTVKDCLAFNHKSKGFDNNNSSCTGSFENCVSFDNGYNYYLPPFTITKWINIKGFEGNSSDQLPKGYSASIPSSSDQTAIRNKVEETRKSIVEKCGKNIIPGEVYFDIF